MITNRAITPPHLPRIDPSFYASFNLTHKKSTDNFVPPSAQKRYPPRSFLSFVQLLPLPSRKIKERKKEKKREERQQKENKERREGRNKRKKNLRERCAFNVKDKPAGISSKGSMARTGQKTPSSGENFLFRSEKFVSCSLTRHPRNLLYTRIYIYIFSISSSLHNGSVSPVPFTQWNRLHRTGIYHRILERGSSYKSGALVKFLLASKRRLPFTVPSPHVSLSLASARRRSPFLWPRVPFASADQNPSNRFRGSSRRRGDRLLFYMPSPSPRAEKE